MTALRLLRDRLCCDHSGSVVIETAFVIPILAILALGGFEASRIVSRQVELQTAAAEAAAIVLANPPDEAAERTTIEEVVETSTELESDQVTFVHLFRCGSDAALVANSDTCATTDDISEFIQLTMTDTYTPIWTSFGIGGALDYSVRRRVQIS